MDADYVIDSLGGTSAVARLCRIRSASVSEWRHRGIPPAREQFLRLLRPDIFGAPPDDAPAPATANEVNP